MQAYMFMHVRRTCSSTQMSLQRPTRPRVSRTNTQTYEPCNRPPAARAALSLGPPCTAMPLTVPVVLPVSHRKVVRARRLAFRGPWVSSTHISSYMSVHMSTHISPYMSIHMSTYMCVHFISLEGPSTHVSHVSCTPLL